MERNFLPNQLAKRHLRFFNFLIDTSLIYFVYYLYVLFSLNENSFIYILFYFLYYFLFESFNGKTIAKYFTDTTAIKDNGGSLTIIDAFKRTIIRIIPGEFLSCLFNKFGYSWHDEFSKTIVLPDKEL